MIQIVSRFTGTHVSCNYCLSELVSMLETRNNTYFKNFITNYLLYMYTYLDIDCLSPNINAAIVFGLWIGEVGPNVETNLDASYIGMPSHGRERVLYFFQDLGMIEMERDAFSSKLVKELESKP
ncbi:hypothetical protein ACJX0J_028872, partial [Zea mays]